MNKKVKLDKKNESVNVTIEALSHDGRGIARIMDKTTFIHGALPNEAIRCQITNDFKRYKEGQAIEVLQANPDRVAPPCEHFGVCGGCSLQHMSMEHQLQHKLQTLLEQLKHFGKVTPEHILPPLTALELGYRRKARLGVKFVIKKNKLLVGFREKSSRYLADLKYCMTLHPAIGMHLGELADLISSLHSYRDIPQIEVAIGDETIALVFRHLSELPNDDKEKLIAFAANHSTNPLHIYLQPNPPAPITKLWPADNIHSIHYTLPEQDLRYSFHPLDFTQVNLEMNRMMVTRVLELLDLKSDDKVLDLFCGIGNFTLPIAKKVSHVTGVEGSELMVARAKYNADQNKIQNVEFCAANLAEPQPKQQWMQQTYDKILLDPPRVGAKEILPFFKHFASSRIAYVSCNPATLARDAGTLVHEHGFHLKQVGIMNMFPHTAHIEAIAIFEKTRSFYGTESASDH